MPSQFFFGYFERKKFGLEKIKLGNFFKLLKSS